MKNFTNYFSDNMINIKNLDPNEINIDEKSWKDVLIYYTGYATVKNLSYVTINSVNPLYFIIDKTSWYFEKKQ